jgi:hypothetical protein
VVEVALRDATGQALHDDVLPADVSAGGSLRAGEVSWPLDALTAPLVWLDLTLRDRDGRVRSVSRWTCATGDDLRALHDLTRPRLEATWSAPGRTLTVHNVGDEVALGVRAVDARPVDAPGYVWFGTGDLTLFPGERRTIDVGGSGTDPDPHAVAVVAWHLERQLVD